MKKIMSLLFLVISCSTFEGGTLKSMQDDFDKIRMDKMLYLFQVIKKYEEQTKSLPFANDSLPVAIVFESKSQDKGNKHFNTLFLDFETRVENLNNYQRPKRIDIVDDIALINRVQSELKISVPNLLDPQNIPVKKPCIVVVTIYKNVFDVTVFTHSSYTFSRPLGEFNNKVTITSSYKSIPKMGIWTFDDFMQNRDVKEYMSKKLNRGGYRFLFFDEKNKEH